MNTKHLYPTIQIKSKTLQKFVQLYNEDPKNSSQLDLWLNTSDSIATLSYENSPNNVPVTISYKDLNLKSTLSSVYSQINANNLMNIQFSRIHIKAYAKLKNTIKLTMLSILPNFTFDYYKVIDVSEEYLTFSSFSQDSSTRNESYGFIRSNDNDAI